MKKMMFLMITLFLAYSVNSQNSDKKTFEASMEFAKLSKTEIAKITPLNKEKVESIQAIRKQKLSKDDQKVKIKEIKKATGKKIIELIGKKKYSQMMKYWKEG